MGCWGNGVMGCWGNGKKVKVSNQKNGKNFWSFARTVTGFAAFASIFLANLSSRTAGFIPS
jgi:hypothetical protein